MSEGSAITGGTKFKAFFCRICPLCVAARRWPDSGFARKFRRKQRDCPFCRAYARLRQARLPAGQDQQ